MSEPQVPDSPTLAGTAVRSAITCSTNENSDALVVQSYLVYEVPMPLKKVLSVSVAVLQYCSKVRGNFLIVGSMSSPKIEATATTVTQFHTLISGQTSLTKHLKYNY